MLVFRTRLFGLPTLIAIKYKGCTYDYLYNSILDRMASVINNPFAIYKCQLTFYKCHLACFCSTYGVIAVVLFNVACFNIILLVIHDACLNCYLLLLVPVLSRWMDSYALRMKQTFHTVLVYCIWQPLFPHFPFLTSFWFPCFQLSFSISLFGQLSFSISLFGQPLQVTVCSMLRSHCPVCNVGVL